MPRNIAQKLSIRTFPHFNIITCCTSKGVFSGVLNECSDWFLVIGEGIDTSALPYIPSFDEWIIAACNNIGLALLSKDWPDSMWMSNQSMHLFAYSNVPYSSSAISASWDKYS